MVVFLWKWVMFFFFFFFFFCQIILNYILTIVNVSLWTPWILCYYLMFLFQWAIALISPNFQLSHLQQLAAQITVKIALSVSCSFVLQGLVGPWAEFIHRPWKSPTQTLSFLKCSPHFPVASFSGCPSYPHGKTAKTWKSTCASCSSKFLLPFSSFPTFVHSTESSNSLWVFFFYILLRIYSYLQAIQLGAYSSTPEVETPILILWNKTFFCHLPETHCDNI